MRAALLALALVACRPPRADLAQAAQRLEAGDARAALAAYDAIAADARRSAAERADALVGAARACERLGDDAGAHERLERAVTPEVPGHSEPALFLLAERLRATDRARALNLYYRAAAGAEKHRGRGFPYRAAMDRILQLSLSR